MHYHDDLALATEHVARAKHFFVEQQARIARLRFAGCPTLDAEHTLDVFVSTLATLEEHERHIRHELSQRTP